MSYLVPLLRRPGSSDTKSRVGRLVNLEKGSDREGLNQETEDKEGTVHPVLVDPSTTTFRTSSLESRAQRGSETLTHHERFESESQETMFLGWGTLNSLLISSIFCTLQTLQGRSLSTSHF